MVAAIFEELGTIATSFVSFLVSMFESVVSIFWTPGTGDDPGQLTFVGILLLISIATGLVMWGLSYLRRFIRIRTKA